MLNWIKNLFKPSEINIWKDVKVEYLRKEMDFGSCPQDITYLNIYAHHQICIITGQRRIIEKGELFKVEEFELEEYFPNKENLKQLEKAFEDMANKQKINK